MRDRARIGQVVALVLVTLVTARAWAEGQDHSSSPSLYDQASGQPMATPSGNILGYQPIPNTALPNVALQPLAPQPISPQPISPPLPPHAQTGGSPTAPATPSAYDYTTWLVGQGPYTLGRDDIVQVNVRNQPDFTGTFIVGPDGYIQYNYLGDIPVLGMTKYEVEQVLTKLLEPYIRVPQVSVVIVGYNSKAVYVIGEVSRPGKYIMRGDVIKLRETILAAGLPTPNAALWRTHVIKPDLKAARVRQVNLKKILYKGKLEDDIDLYPGEIVVVPSTVISSVNRFLSQLLNPITRAAASAALGAGL